MSDRTFLAAADILAAADLDTDEVYVSQWGTWVRVRSMTAGQRNQFAALMFKGGGGASLELDVSQIPGAMAQVVAWCAVGSDGKRMFADRDIDALNDKHGDALQTVFEAALRVSGIGSDEADRIEKNSGTGLSAGSASA